MELGSAYHVSDLLASALDGHVVLILRVVEPLEVAVPLGIVSPSFACIGIVDLICGHETCPHPEVLELGCVHHVLIELHVGEGRDTVLRGEGNGCILVVLAGFGRDVDDTVCALGSVDGSRRSVLEDGDGKDVVGVHSHHGRTRRLDTVDDEQRLRRGRERTCSVDLEGDVVITRHTTGREHLHTCDLTLKEVECGCGRCVLHNVGFDCGDGSYDVSYLAGRTVTHDNGALKDCGILFESRIDGFLAGYSDDDVLVSDCLENEGCVCRYCD